MAGGHGGLHQREPAVHRQWVHTLRHHRALDGLNETDSEDKQEADSEQDSDESEDESEDEEEIQS